MSMFDLTKAELLMARVAVAETLPRKFGAAFAVIGDGLLGRYDGNFLDRIQEVGAVVQAACASLAINAERPADWGAADVLTRLQQVEADVAVLVQMAEAGKLELRPDGA